MNPIKLVSKWLDNQQVVSSSEDYDWFRVIPFIGLHLSCLFVLSVGVSSTALLVCLISYFIRMFAITAFYHRFLSHKSFKTSRFVQFIFAFLGTAATQRGPLWWAAHHRNHHKYSDTAKDAHSPNKGFLYSHMLWFLRKDNFNTDYERVKDLAQYKELKWLDRFDIIPPIIFATIIFLLGIWIELQHPELQASRWQVLIWGFFVSTIILSHVTYMINSLAHRWGYRTFDTRDDSRNNPLLALLTLGEGWHNNHHKYPGSVRQGLRWWEIDISFYILKILSWFKIVWDLRIIDAHLIKKERL